MKFPTVQFDTLASAISQVQVKRGGVYWTYISFIQHAGIVVPVAFWLTHIEYTLEKRARAKRSSLSTNRENQMKEIDCLKNRQKGRAGEADRRRDVK